MNLMTAELYLPVAMISVRTGNRHWCFVQVTQTTLGFTFSSGVKSFYFSAAQPLSQPLLHEDELAKSAEVRLHVRGLWSAEGRSFSVMTAHRFALLDPPQTI